MGRPKVGRPRTVNMFWVIVFHHPGAVYEYSIISPRIMKDDDVWNVVQSRKGTPVKVETYCFDNIEDATQVYESFMEEHGRTPLKLKVVDGQVVAEDDEDKKKGKGKGKGNAPRNNGKATLKANKAKGVHMKKSRDNATFTLDQTYGSGDGHRTLIEVFYDRLNELYPGSTHIPIPPEWQIHPQHDAKTQAFIFADYTVRKIVPIRLRDEGLKAYAERLEQLKPITDVETARAAVAFLGRRATRAGVHAAHVAYDAYDAAYDATYPANATYVAARAASAASAAHGAAAWKVVNEMLQEICGQSPRKNGKATLTANKAKGVHMKKSRDNATFTLDQTYGSGNGERTIVELFYDRLNEHYLGDRPIPIPEEWQVEPTQKLQKQLYILADFAIRKFTPIRMRGAGYQDVATELESLPKVMDRDTAAIATDSHRFKYLSQSPEARPLLRDPDQIVTYAALAVATHHHQAVANAVSLTADIVSLAATVDPDATWAAVNEMLREICGESPRDNGKVTLKSKTKSKVTIKTHDDGHHDHHGHHHHLDLEGSMGHYRDNAGANLRQLSEALGHLSINFPDIMQSIEANLSFSAVSTDSKDMAFIVCTEVTSKFLPLFLHMKDNRKAAAAAKKLPAVTSEASLKKCLNGLEKIYSQLSDEMPESWHRGIYSADSERVSYGLDFVRNAHSLLTQVEHLLNTNQDSSLDWFAGKLGGEFIVNGLNSNRKAIHDHPASSVDISTGINSLLTRLKGGRDNRSYRDNVTFRDFVYDTDYDRRDPVYNTDHYVGQVPKSSVIVDSFYDSLPGLFGDVHLDIPDPRILVVATDEDQQAAIFADYALRVFTPMGVKLALPAHRAEVYTRSLEVYHNSAPKITDRNSASKAVQLAGAAGFDATYQLMILVASGDTDHDTLERIGFYTAQLVRLAYDSYDSAPGKSNRQLTASVKSNRQLIDAVNRMLQEICGKRPLPLRKPSKK